MPRNPVPFYFYTLTEQGMLRKKFLAIIIFFLFCLNLPAQEPLQQYRFTQHKTGFAAGDASVSPSGKWLLASFNDLGKNVVYELVDLSSMRMAATGTLEDKPYNLCWSADSKYLLVEYIYRNPVLYDMSSGMKKLLTLSRKGTVVFKPMNSLLDPKPKDPEIFVFDEQVAYRYNIQGKLLDSLEQDEYHSVSAAWYNQLQRNFTILNGDGFDTYSAQGKYISSKPVTGLDVYKSFFTDPDGGTITFYDRNSFTRYDVATGKIVQEANEAEGLYAVCLTPDKKNTAYKSSGKLTLMNEKGAKTSTPLKDYYSKMYYTGFGTGLVCINPDEVKIYACKNYLPFAAAAPVVKPAPPVVVKKEPAPKVKKTPAVPAKPKWNQPYTVADFITPKTSDSFYLYTADRGLKYFIKYTKGEPNILWPNPFFYSQYMGFGSEQKYQSYYTYLLDNTDGEARMGTYAYGSAYGSKEQMVGGPNFLAKIPAAGQTLSWNNKLYQDEYTLTAQVVDMVYKGKPKKFLSVSRGGTYNGQPIDESWYYQLGVGLTFIKSGGKIVYERVF